MGEHKVCAWIGFLAHARPKIHLTKTQNCSFNRLQHAIDYICERRIIIIIIERSMNSNRICSKSIC